jgi:hypothetical protein
VRGHTACPCTSTGEIDAGIEGNDRSVDVHTRDTDTGHTPASWWRAWLWFGASAAWFVVASIASVLLSVVVAEYGATRFALIAMAWSILGATGLLVLAQAAAVSRGRGRGVRQLSIADVVAGTFLTVGYVAWALARFSTLDPDMLGAGVFLAPLGISVGLCAAASCLLSRPAATLALGIASIGMLALTAMGLANLPGLDDGLSREGTAILLAGVGVAVLWLLTVALFLSGLRRRA